MRERLITAFVGLTILVVAAYGIPRAYFLADQIRTQEHERVSRTADLVGVAVAQQVGAGRPVSTAYLDSLAASGEDIVFTPTSGAVVRSHDHDADSDGSISAHSAVQGIGTVTVTRDGTSVGDEISAALVPLVLIGLGLVVVAGAIGYVMARRLSRPFRELAGAARDLGAGRLELDLPPYRVPEAQEIAKALTTSGERLDLLIRHERDLAVKASHELRTPITALRLELEDLSLSPSSDPAVAASLQRSLAALDRLEAAVSELLAFSRDLAAGGEIDLDLSALVADTVSRAGGGRRVEHTATVVLPTRVDPAPVVKALDLLLVDGTHVATFDRTTHLEITIAPASGAEAEAARLIASAGGQLARSDGGVLLLVPKRPLTDG